MTNQANEEADGPTLTFSRWGASGSLTNRQRIARYDLLIERAQQRADEAPSLTIRRKSLNLILRLQLRALRELGRGR